MITENLKNVVKMNYGDNVNDAEFNQHFCKRDGRLHLTFSIVFANGVTMLLESINS